MLIIEASFALSSQIHNYIPFLFNNKDTYYRRIDANSFRILGGDIIMLHFRFIIKTIENTKDSTSDSDYIRPYFSLYRHQLILPTILNLIQNPVEMST